MDNFGRPCGGRRTALWGREPRRGCAQKGSAGVASSGGADAIAARWRVEQLSNEGAGLVLQVILDAETDRGVHVEAFDVGRGEEPDLGRFSALAQLAAGDPAGEADRELL